MKLNAFTIREKLARLRESVKPGDEQHRASRFWAHLETYHLTNDSDEVAIRRSKWLAEEVLTVISPNSILELGCNTGRNLVYIDRSRSGIRLGGTDVNQLALEVARRNLPHAQFLLEDLHDWQGTSGQWDAILTMSVLDHVPRKALPGLASRVSSCARFVIGVELWDGSEGVRGLYKYSHDLRALYESVGYTTVSWSQCPRRVQYDERNSPLWLYLGEKRSS